jgi:hypothetical protein
MTEDEFEVDLDAGSFDLGEWLSGKTTTARYTTTVRTDKDAFRRVIELQEKGRDLHTEITEAEKSAEKSAGSGSIGEVSPAAARVVELKEEFAKLKKEHDEARKALDASELTIVVSATGGSVNKGIMTVLQEHFPEVLQGGEISQSNLMRVVREHPEVLEKQNSLMIHDTIESITNAKGQVVRRGDITLEQVEQLIASVGVPDREKLARHMGLAINSSSLTEEVIDAGFPG